MKKFVLLAAIALVALSVPVLAAGFTATVGSYGEVLAEDTINVAVTVHNDYGSEELFLISQPLAAPPAYTWASADKGSLIIPAYSDGTFTIKITPASNAVAGNYRYEFTIKRNSNGETLSQEFQITVKQRQSAGGVRLNLSCSQCTNNVGVTANVENFGTTKLNDAMLKVTLGDQTADLSAGELNLSGKKQLTTSFNVLYWKPGQYALSAELTANGQSLDRKTVEFTIPEVKNIVITQNVQTTPWSKNVLLNAQNLGNVLGTADIKAQVTQASTVSISYSQPPTTLGDEWTWTTELKPGENYQVSYTEFYWPVPIVILLVVLGAAYIYLYTTAIGMKKRAVKHGSEWSVSINIKNRGSAAEGVVVRDVIPHHFTLSGTFETLKPIARKTDTGTELIWRVGGIKRGEEKLLHYKMTARTPFGSVKLPAARLRAQKGDKTLLSSTNTVTLSGEKGPVKLKVDTE
jgi:hypothetical protein